MFKKGLWMCKIAWSTLTSLTSYFIFVIILATVVVNIDNFQRLNKLQKDLEVVQEFKPERGEKGERGDTGATGLWGLRGPQGPRGERGYYVDLPTLYKQTSPAVVWIGAEDEDKNYSGDPYLDVFVGTTIKWQGTGFLVTPCLIATAGHVVENTKSFEVLFQDGTIAKADFVHMEDRERCDVGFIRLRKEYRIERSYLKFDIDVEAGESVVILGYPWGLNNGITITKGIVSLPNRYEPYFGTKLIIHTDAAAWSGNSGGPVIDMNGEVVGILIGKSLEGDNFSMVTPARLVELAMQKAIAEIRLMDLN